MTDVFANKLKITENEACIEFGGWRWWSGVTVEIGFTVMASHTFFDLPP